MNVNDAEMIIDMVARFHRLVVAKSSEKTEKDISQQFNFRHWRDISRDLN